MTLAALRHLWPWLVVALFLFGVIELVHSQRVEAEKNGQLTAQIKTITQQRDDESAVADVLADQAQAARAAITKRDQTVHQSEQAHEASRQAVRAATLIAPVQDCLHQPVAPDVDRVLAGAGAASNPAAASAGQP